VTALLARRRRRRGTGRLDKEGTSMMREIGF
jgi:hypothetical protein